jgi:hypothetical protein
MICGRRRTGTVSTEVDSPPKWRVSPEPGPSSVPLLSMIEDAHFCPTQQVRNSEKDRPMPMKGSILR